MRHYALGYREALSLPIRTFWLMNATVNRLDAEHSLRMLEVMAASRSGEGYEGLRESLLKEMGTMMVMEEPEPELDLDGLNALRMMM